MSAQAVDWALKIARTDAPIHKLVLVAMANHARRDGTCSYLSAASIAEQVGCSERSVQRHLVQLEAGGLIRRGDQSAAEHIDPRYRPIVYDVALVQVRQNDAPHPVGTTESGVEVRQNPRSGTTLVSYKPRTNQELREGRSDRNSADPLLASLRTEIPRPAPRCAHGEPLHRHPNCVA